MDFFSVLPEALAGAAIQREGWDYSITHREGLWWRDEYVVGSGDVEAQDFYYEDWQVAELEASEDVTVNFPTALSAAQDGGIAITRSGWERSLQASDGVWTWSDTGDVVEAGEITEADFTGDWLLPAGSEVVSRPALGNARGGGSNYTEPDTGSGTGEDLGTAAYLDAGTDPGDLVQLDDDGALPAVDGSNLTGLDSGDSHTHSNFAELEAYDPFNFATGSQGSLADSALQPGDIPSAAALSSAVLNSHIHTNKSNLDAYNPANFATAAQGALASSAVQPDALPPQFTSLDRAGVDATVGSWEESQCHITGGTLTLTLPASPSDGDKNKFFVKYNVVSESANEEDDKVVIEANSGQYLGPIELDYEMRRVGDSLEVQWVDEIDSWVILSWTTSPVSWKNTETSTAYTVEPWESVDCIASTSYNVTLPDHPIHGDEVRVIHKSGVNTITIQAPGGHTLGTGISYQLEKPTHVFWAKWDDNGNTWVPLSYTNTDQISIRNAGELISSVATTMTGTLFCDGSTIGNDSSGADFTGETYRALFDVCKGISGNAGTEDFDSNDTVTIPDLRGRVMVGKDDMGGSAANRLTSGGSGISGDTLGAAGGSQTHTLTTAQLASHTHSGPSHSHSIPSHTHSIPAHSHQIGEGRDSAFLRSGTNRDAFRPTNYNAGVGGYTHNANRTTSSVSQKTNSGGSGTTGSASGTTGSAGSGSAHNNTQPSLVVNYFITF